VTNETNANNWVALVPITLGGFKKRCLEIVEQRGSYTMGEEDWFDAQYSDELCSLEEGEFIRAHRDDNGEIFYRLTEIGRLWLKRCTENTGEYELADEVTALFDSFDEATQRRFAWFAAMRIGMALHPEADEEMVEPNPERE
jgi:hypothetical protein